MSRNLFFGAALLFMAASCSSDTTVGDLIGGNDSSVGSSSDANSIIKYSNAVIKFDSDARKKLEDAQDDIVDFEKSVSSKKPPFSTLFHAFIGISVSDVIGFGSDKVDIKKPGSFLSTDVADKIKPKVTAMVESYKNVEEAYENYSTYIDNEDYLDDDWAKASEYISTMKTNLEKFYTNEKEYFDIIEPVTDDAEEIILADHPLKEEILQAKKTLRSVDKIVEFIGVEKPNMTDLNKSYSTLEGEVKTGEGLDQAALKKQSRDSQHESFYSSVTDFLGEVRKSKRDEIISNGEYNYIISDYNSVISSYNSFVD